MIKLTSEEVKRNVKYHYQRESTDGHVAVIDLFLFKDHNFDYSIASNVYSAYSTGYWSISKGVLTLNSDLQQRTLPIEISYRRRDSSDFNVRKIAFVRDLNDKPIPYAFVHINNDSTSCMDGDLLCVGDYKQIDSVKVVLENQGPSSRWMSIMPNEGLIQITIPIKRSLENYFILRDQKYGLKKDRLVELHKK